RAAPPPHVGAQRPCAPTAPTTPTPPTTPTTPTDAKPTTSMINVMPGSIGAIVRAFKSATTKRINESRHTPGAPVWQRNYYECIIRDERALECIRAYIIANPLRWALDRENVQHTGTDEFDTWLERDLKNKGG
ncbi:MAG: transposase, partial [Roseiflexus sp.]